MFMMHILVMCSPISTFFCFTPRRSIVDDENVDDENVDDEGEEKEDQDNEADDDDDDDDAGGGAGGAGAGDAHDHEKYINISTCFCCLLFGLLVRFSAWSPTWSRSAMRRPPSDGRSAGGICIA